MKKIFSSVLLITIITSAYSQYTDKRWNIGLQGGSMQYNGDLGTGFYNTNQAEYYFGGISFSRFLGRHFDLVLQLTSGETGYYEENEVDFKTSVSQANLNFRFKFIGRNAAVNPFLFLGGGMLMFDKKYSVNKVTYNVAGVGGGGLNFRLSNTVNIQLYECLFYSDDDLIDGVKKDNNDAYLQHTLALTFNLGHKEKDSDNDGVTDSRDKCNDTPAGILVDKRGCPSDKDDDGIADFKDDCPDERGLATAKGCPDKDFDGVPDKSDDCPGAKGLPELNGCPDRDGDGIADKNDACPDSKGLAKFMGCPDTDNDGIIDPRDSCPTFYGLIEFNGCPDSDGDGIIDKYDQCPTVRGTAEFNGCPPVEKQVQVVDTLAQQKLIAQEKEALKNLFLVALHGIQFEIASEVLKQASFPILDSIAFFMNELPDIKLNIYGHTDAVGDSTMNRMLSTMRANEVKQYLMIRNVDESRLHAEGFGSTKPIATNKTKEGRAANRRVEFVLVE